MQEKKVEIVSQCRKLSHSAENALFHILIHVLTILIHWLGFRLSVPYLNTCITYLNTLIRLSALRSISCRLSSAANQKRPLHHPSRQPIRIEHQKNPSISSANQNRVLRHPRELSAPGGPFSALGSRRLAIAYLNTWETSKPPHQLISHSYL